MIETCIRITAPHFVCGVDVWDGKVVLVAPIVAYMRGWTETYLRTYCYNKGWKVEVVSQIERKRPGRKPHDERSTPDIS